MKVANFTTAFVGCTVMVCFSTEKADQRLSAKGGEAFIPMLLSGAPQGCESFYGCGDQGM